MKSKKLLLSLGFVLFLAFAGHTSYGQNSVVKVNIFSLLVKTFNVSFEQKINANSSAQLGFFYTGYSVSDTKFSGFGLTPEYRYYLSDTEAPKGVYIAPFLRYQSFKLEDNSSGTSNEGKLTTFGGGLLIGKQWIFKERVSLDIFLGPAYYSGDTKVTSGSNTFDTGAFDGFTIRTGLTFGVAF